MRIFQNEISIVLCGQAGSGIQTVETLLTRLLKQNQFCVYSNKEYMSRVRGGCNSTLIRVGSDPVRAWVDRIDLLVPLQIEAFSHLRARISPDTLVLYDGYELGDGIPRAASDFLEVPFRKIATEIGNPLYSNIVAVGFLAALFGIQESTVEDVVTSFMSKKTPEIIGQNRTAAREGYIRGKKVVSSDRIRIDISRTPEIRNHLFLSGGEAVGLGALAGGCNFVSSYPMSPSTPVLTFLAQQASKLGLIVEQAEDEIAALNMVLGAWYAGARGLATTSGGGFSLMAEAMSLAGMIETPAVIHLAQRPGPATGLPTRTEQGDLELALYAGHGEFPRILLAPGTLEQAYELTRKAFGWADRFQSPVVVLTDQYLIDLFYTLEPLLPPNEPIQHQIVETAAGYQRYEITADGVSPRGIPGFGAGLVGVDSDEHDQQGHITEDPVVRIAMNDKRLRKREGMRIASLEPEAWPRGDCPNLVVCWGSTYWMVRESIERIGRDDLGLLHFSQVYPLHPNTARHFSRARNIILLEGNATGQFGKLLQLSAGIEPHHQILKYDGLPFSVEWIVSNLNAVLS